MDGKRKRRRELLTTSKPRREGGRVLSFALPASAKQSKHPRYIIQTKKKKTKQEREEEMWEEPISAGLQLVLCSHVTIQGLALHLTIL